MTVSAGTSTFQVVIPVLALASQRMPIRLMMTKTTIRPAATAIPAPLRVPTEAPTIGGLYQPLAQEATDAYWTTASTSIGATVAAWM